MVVLKQPPPKIVYFRRRLSKEARLHKSIFGGGHATRPASKKAKAQQAQVRLDSRFGYKYRDLGLVWQGSGSSGGAAPLEELKPFWKTFGKMAPLH